MMCSLKLITLICLCFAATLVSSQTNYCAKGLCKQGKSHIACGHSGKFSGTCPSDARLVQMANYKALILNSHNTKRNQIASGQLPRYNSAKRMGTMTWNDELAKLAALNVMQCKMDHDCHNTNTLRNSGQNLRTQGYKGSGSGFSDAAMIQQGIDSWWNEHTQCNMNIINKYPDNYNGPQIGHFTVMTSERNNLVGCAVARYTTSDGWQNFLMACNYAYTNMIGERLYESGPTASGCKTGKNPTYTGLCSTREVY